MPSLRLSSHRVPGPRHVLDSTGAIRAATVVHALRRNQLKYGMVTMCVGAGMGAAGIIERV